jgi:molecular chaperone HscC
MIVGIDLGTTNSLVAVWKDGKVQVIPNSLGSPLTPSVVGLDDEGRVLVGQAARDRLVSHPDLTTAFFKRTMGTQHVVKLGKRQFRSEELSSLVLRSLKADAEAFLGEAVTEAIVTVPAYFNDTQRKATRAAGELAGLKVERLLNEPTAAALAYGVHEAKGEQKFIVLDLGGGTFDVSILHHFEGVMEVRSSAGDNYLGGEDFVDCLMAAFEKAVGGYPKFKNDQERRKFGQKLRNQAEKAKRELSRADSAVIELKRDGGDLKWEVDVETFEKLSKPLLDRIVGPVERAIRDSKIQIAELDQVILAGGATRMPIIRKLVSRMFGRLPNSHLDPDQVVAMGAAVQAGLKSKDKALDDIVMTDVCPYTLGVEVVGSLGRKDQKREGYFLPILERNTMIPVSKVETLNTVNDHQNRIHLKIYQGESRLVKDNVFLGDMHINVLAKKAGEESIEVRFTYEVNGLLEVESTTVSTGEKKSIVIEQNPGVLTPAEIQKRLKELEHLKIHPRDQGQNMALLARAGRLFEEHLGHTRMVISDHIKYFEGVLDGQDLLEIAEARKVLEDFLNEVEGKPIF